MYCTSRGPAQLSTRQISFENLKLGKRFLFCFTHQRMHQACGLKWRYRLPTSKALKRSGWHSVTGARALTKAKDRSSAPLAVVAQTVIDQTIIGRRRFHALILRGRPETIVLSPNILLWLVYAGQLCLAFKLKRASDLGDGISNIVQWHGKATWLRRYRRPDIHFHPIWHSCIHWSILIPNRKRPTS